LLIEWADAPLMAPTISSKLNVWLRLFSRGIKSMCNVIGHDYRDVKAHFSSVIVEAVSQNQVAGGRGKLPPQMGGESYEMCPGASFYVRQIAAVLVLAVFHEINMEALRLFALSHSRGLLHPIPRKPGARWGPRAVPHEHLCFIASILR